MSAVMYINETLDVVVSAEALQRADNVSQVADLIGDQLTET